MLSFRVLPRALRGVPRARGPVRCSYRVNLLPSKQERFQSRHLTVRPISLGDERGTLSGWKTKTGKKFQKVENCRESDTNLRRDSEGTRTSRIAENARQTEF